jgi:hypothetical protein
MITQNLKKDENHVKHAMHMALCCIVSMILIALLPFVGVSKVWSFGIGLTVMIVMHLFMMHK